VRHQELTAAHHPEAGADLVAELPLDIVEGARQVAIAPRRIPEDHGNHLFGGGAEKDVAIVAILDAQHLCAIVVVAARFAPQVGRLNGRHKQLDGTGPVLLLAYDLLDLAQHAMAQRQPGIDAGSGLPDQPGAQHQLMADDLGVGGRLLHHRQEVAGQAHETDTHG
jgi:hypothetical protein